MYPNIYADQKTCDAACSSGMRPQTKATAATNRSGYAIQPVRHRLEHQQSEELAYNLVEFRRLVATIMNADLLESQCSSEDRSHPSYPAPRGELYSQP